MGSWQLSLRTDFLVEGCEAVALGYLYQKAVKKRNGIPIESPQPPPPPKSEYELRFRWMRGPVKMVCCRGDCPNANDFSPLSWSQKRDRGRSIQCIDDSMRRKMGLGKHTTFCGVSCFQKAWMQRQPTNAEVASVDTPRQEGKTTSDSRGGRSRYRSHSDLTDGTWPAIDDNSGEWVEVSKDKRYSPAGSDVGCPFKVECTAVSLADGKVLFGPRSVLTEPVLSAPPSTPKRTLATVKDAGVGGGFRFRILSYNLLAEIYATQQMYPYCEGWAVGWSYRVVNLLRELIDAAADILCLQEVQADHFEDHIKPRLQEGGFEGIFKQKTREAMGHKGKVDGCALFWRRSKLRLCEHYAMEFNQVAHRTARNLAQNDDEEREILTRLLKDNIAQAAVLEVLGPRNVASVRGGRMNNHAGVQFCVANTHLYSNNYFPDVKLWQCKNLIHKLNELVGIASGRQLPLVICGDFNSLPSSAVYSLLANRSVRDDHPDLLDDTFRVCPSNELRHDIPLKSAYATVLNGQEPEFTNYTANFTGVLDYIWYTPTYIRPLAVAGMPQESELKQAGAVAVPNCIYSSDHMMLCADMQLGGQLGQNGMMMHNTHHNGNQQHQNVRNYG